MSRVQTGTALALGATLLLAPGLAVGLAPPEPVEPGAAEPPLAAPASPEPARASSPVVSDGPVAVTTRLSPDPSNVGDLLVLEVTAAYPRDVRVNLPTQLSFEPLHHVRTEEGEPEPTGEGLRKTFRVELQRFEVGEAQVPSFPVTYVDAQGQVHTVTVPARTFVVESLLVNEDDPQRKGEDPPISQEYPDTFAEAVIWSVLGTLLLALVTWLVLRRLWRRDRTTPAPPPIPAHELAFGALDELERGELLQHGQVQRYYVELTEIAKGYLERRFALDALDRTTEEIRAELRRDGSRVAPLSADDVIDFLEECDLVKFARLQPPEQEAREALVSVRGMVEVSIPKAGPPPPAADAPAADASDDAAPDGEVSAAGALADPDTPTTDASASESVAVAEPPRVEGGPS
ncbi:MAG: hypothetical protein AB1Z98_09275 [Nannocystaceae bacterium]